eukprot:SAG31_NODE_748_length_12390_cov_6.306484_15_plen_61_part_00
MSAIKFKFKFNLKASVTDFAQSSEFLLRYHISIFAYTQSISPSESSLENLRCMSVVSLTV